MFKKNAVVSAVFAAWCMTSWGADVAQQYVAALAENPTIAAAKNDLKSALAKADSVRRHAWTPEFSFTALRGVQTYASSGLAAGQSADSLQSSKYTARVNQLITDFGKSSSLVDESLAQVSQAQARLRDAENETLFTSLNAQWALERARVAEFYAKRAEASVKQQASLENSMVELGKGYESSVLQAKVQLSAATTRYRRAEGAVLVSTARAETMFGSVAAIPSGQLLRAKRDQLPATLDAALAAALTGNPKLALGAARTESLRNRANLTHADEYLPRLDVYAEQSLRRNVDATTNSPSFGDRKVMLQLQYNLNLGGGANAAVDAAQADVQSSVAQEAQTRRQVVEATTVAWRNMRTALYNRDTLANQVRIAAKYFEMASAERAAGRRTLVELLNAEIALVNAMADLADTEGELAVAEMSLLNVTGGLKLASLEPVEVTAALPRVIR